MLRFVVTFASLTLLATSHAQVSPDQAPPGLNAPGALPAPDPRGAFLPPRLSSVIPSSAETARILDGLDDSPEARSVRSTTFALWSARDPEAALEWLKQNPPTGAEETILVQPLAEAFAARDANEALRITDTLPESMRMSWRAAVDGYRARSDTSLLPAVFANAAAARTRDPGQSAIFMPPALGAARANPAVALMMLGPLDETTRIHILSIVVPGWAQTDSGEASRWAAELTEPELRYWGVRGVAFGWGRNNLPGARSWVLGLPNDAARDVGLDALLTMDATDGVLDDVALLEEFGSNSARQDAVLNAARAMARRDVAQARALLDRYVTDPEQLRDAELAIERAAREAAAARRATAR